MALSTEAKMNILRMILKGEHYRKAVIDQIAEDFLHFTIQFFKDITTAKIEGKKISKDWYKRYFLTGKFPKSETAIYAGLNNKTIHNIYGRTTREVVFEVSPQNYGDLLEKIDALISDDDDSLEIQMAIKYNNVSATLSLSETMIVVNTLGVKRSEIRGGAWSGLGKRLELPLMLALAKLYQVPARHYAGKGLTGENREVDFHFLNRAGDQFFCEVKLMGKGNPESADAIIARDTDIFIADTLSTLNKQQLTQRGCKWIELRESNGYRRIYEVFSQLDIPCDDFTGNLDSALDEIIPQVF